MLPLQLLVFQNTHPTLVTFRQTNKGPSTTIILPPVNYPSSTNNSFAPMNSSNITHDEIENPPSDDPDPIDPAPVDDLPANQQQLHYIQEQLKQVQEAQAQDIAQNSYVLSPNFSNDIMNVITKTVAEQCTNIIQKVENDANGYF